MAGFSVIEQVNDLAKELKKFRRRRHDKSETFVKDAYEGHWSKTKQAVEEKIGGGETLAHIVLALRRRPHLLQQGKTAEAIATQLRRDVGFAEDDKFLRATVAGLYQLAANIDPVVLLTERARSARTIVELGSGPGWNLFEIALLLGRRAEEIRFFALEYTESGLAVTGRLSAMDGAPAIGAHHFDYRKPDLGMVPDDGPTLIFSYHSIEQVEDISEDLYDQIAQRRHPVTLVHFEPIGWQRIPEFGDARRADNDDFFRALVMKRQDIADGRLRVAADSAINSWRAHYNRNVLGLLQKRVESGTFTKVGELFDFTSINNTNILNPTTYLELEVARPAFSKLALWGGRAT